MEFESAIQALSDGAVDFAVVGDIAGVVHGSRHADMVLAICYSRTVQNSGRLLRALAGSNPRLRGAPASSPFVWDEAALHNSAALALHTDQGDIDLLAELAGVGGWDEVKAQSREIDAFERRISVLDLPALIRSKRAAGRPKDLAVIPELESLPEAIEPE
jgi:hypothetical protein